MGEKRPILCLLNTGEQCDKCDVCGLFNKRFIQKRNLKDCVYDDYNKQNYNLDMVVVKLNELNDENEQLRQSRDYWSKKTKEHIYYWNCLEKAIEKTFDSDDQCFDEIWKHYDEMEAKWEDECDC